MADKIDQVIAARLPLWKRVFEEDENSIQRSLSTLAWDLAAYSCLVKIVDRCPNGINAMMLELLVSGFWSKTFLGVRRLAEDETIHGARGVCSLRGLIEDLRLNQPRLTRRVFVCQVSGLPYDYTLVEKKAWDYRYALMAKGQNSFWVPRELDAERVRHRHELYDWLSGTTPGTSRPDDLIRFEVFEALERRLDTLNPLLEHINVAVAHAATDQSRQGRELDRWPLSDAKATLKILTEVAQLVGDWFCYSGVGYILPTPQFDQFKYLDQPWFTGDRRDLESVWEEFDAESSQWFNVDRESLF